MALIKCTECNETISDKASVCIHCGCPLVNYDNHVENEKVVIKIGSFRKTKVKKFNRWLFETDNRKNTHLSENMFSVGDIFELNDDNGNSLGTYKLDAYSCIFNLHIFGFDNLDDDIAELVFNISTEILNITTVKLSPEIKCPTCGSFEVQKISNTEKVANTAMFGIFGNKRKKQFRCNNCHFMW